MSQFKKNFFVWLHPAPNEIHPWRWRALGVWIVIFTVIVIWSIHTSNNTSSNANRLAKTNSEIILDLKHTKASVVSLEKTNCSLKVFLLTARKTRYDAAVRESKLGDIKAAGQDQQAADGYKQLADRFNTDNCVIPKNLILPGD